MYRLSQKICLSLLLGLGLLSCTPEPTKPNTVQETATPAAVQKVDLSREPIQPIPPANDLNPDMVALGERLFHDTRLSKDNTLSCASCHDLARGGTDLAPVSTGVGGVKGPINSPTVFNSSLNFVQFWDGRAATLAEQAAGPVHNPLEMGSNWDEVLAKLKGDAGYAEAFARLYPDGLTGANIAHAIAEFERSLTTPNSRFDRYLLGDKTALSAEEAAGYELFKAKGCVGCHNGVNVGGNSYQKLGLMRDYFQVRGHLTEADNGRFNVTKNEADKHVFKVPGLRTAALTPPYFHDASCTTLEEAVRLMGRHQLGLELNDDEVNKITLFLKSLVGEFKGKPLL